MMQLNDTLKLLALQLQIDPNELVRLASEDTIGGYNSDATQARWPIGSLWEVEGKVLYSLIRILKPNSVLEIGSLRGCSTTHIATALSVNGRGHVTSVDISAGSGDLMPKHLESVVNSVTADGLEYLSGMEDESIDICFEDSSHGEQMTASVAALCKTKLTPGGILIVHDAAHFLVGKDVQAGLTRALGNAYRVYLSEPSDCGFAAWQRPGFVSQSRADVNAVLQVSRESGIAEKHGLSEAQVMHQALFGITKRGSEQSDESLMAEVNAQIEKDNTPQQAYTADEFAQKLDEIQAEKPAKKKPGRKPKSQTL